MRKQFTIFLILIFILGLVPTNFIKDVKASYIPDPIVYWNFDDESMINAGVAFDQMGNYNGQVCHPEWISNGYEGGALIFDESQYPYSDEKCGVKSSLPRINEFTLLYRIKIVDLSNASTDMHVHSTPGPQGFGAKLYGDKESDPDYKNCIEPDFIGCKSISSSESWYHLAFVMDNDSGRYFYVNGNLSGYSQEAKYTDSGQWTFAYGGYVDNSAPIIWLDEVKIYDTALTADQIQEEYQYNELLCDEDIWECGNWGICSVDGTETRSCNMTFDCPYSNTPSPETTQSCTPECTEDIWECGYWGECASNNKQTRICIKEYDCPLIENEEPETEMSCEYIPPYVPPTCDADTWQCGNWGTCSPQGIQTRSCNRTYDCPSAETASPATSQYCQAPNQPQPQTPSDDLEIVNQSSIIKATVKLLCPVSRTMASQGSGTVIDSDGTILTNKHVVDGTVGCLVGFIDNYNDEPYFADRHIADVYSVSSDSDVAILKLRNPYSRNLTAINISGSNSNNLSLGDQITTYGYPAKFGTKITYTSGDFSGVDGNYLKTTAIIEHGNSGGGAYLKNGAFIGIPSAVMKGELNSMGYVLSVNKINSWLNNSPMAYNNNGNNNYARVSILEDIDLDTLNSLDLFIFNEDENNNIDNSNNQATQNNNTNNSNNQNNSNSQNVITEEKSLITKVDKNLSKRVSGNILLQVEKNGEGWYVYPDNKKKYYLGRPADAFSIMRKLGLGATHEFITNNTIFPDHVVGKILLDVEQNGEAYYIYPKDKKAYYLGRPADAFRVMRELGLGITNNDVRKIDVGEVE